MVLVGPIESESDGVRGGITVGGRRREVTFTSTLRLRPVADAFVLLALPAAMRMGVPLRTEMPLSRGLLDRLPAIQSLYQSWDRGLQSVPVEAPVRDDVPSRADADAVFFTGGVDSFYAALQWPSSALVYVVGLDLKPAQAELLREVESRLAGVARRWGRQLAVLRTDLRAFSDRYLRWQFAFGGALAACGLALTPHFGRFGIASGYADVYEQLCGMPLPDGAHRDLVPQFTNEYCDFVQIGGDARRIEKLAALAGLPEVQGNLRVCWENRGGAYNCGACEKCLRTMASLQSLGCLSEFRCFARPLSHWRLAHEVTSHPLGEIFLRENLEAALANQGDPRLIHSLNTALYSPWGWFWKAAWKWIPLTVRDWEYRVSGLLPRARRAQGL